MLAQVFWDVIRPPDIIICPNAKRCCDLFYRTSSLHDCAAAVYQVYNTFAHRVYSILPLSTLRRPSPIFTRGVKKCEIWPQSSTPLFFEPPSFRNEATHRYQSMSFGTANDRSLFSPNLAQFGPSLLGVEFEGHPPLEKYSLNR